jgi:predicted nucleic acid-binding protein
MSSRQRFSAGAAVVVDTSIVLKWFYPADDGVSPALEVLRAHERDETVLIAPADLPLELINVLTYLGADAEEVERAVRLLTDIGVLIAPVDQSLLVDAARIATTEKTALYDAAFIALAARLDVELVTADLRQAETTSCRVRLIA